MSSFNKLKQLAVTADRKATMVLYDIEGEPELILRPATEANKPYFNALLRRQRKNIRQVQGRQITTAITKENRDSDRELYAEYVIDGWNKMVDDDGNAAEFNQDNALAFLQALPDHIFDDVRLFATSPRNFIPDLPEVDVIVGESEGT